jgi:hypothetical protein
VRQHSSGKRASALTLSSLAGILIALASPWILDAFRHLGRLAPNFNPPSRALRAGWIRARPDRADLGRDLED